LLRCPILQLRGTLAGTKLNSKGVIFDSLFFINTLQKKTKELKDEPQKKPHDVGVTVERAVFVGTTSDLLKKIKAEKQ
jgi:inosine/xanthosine triphosphate pyrophosphatase family protein